MNSTGESRSRRLMRNVLILNGRSIITTVMGIIGTSLCLRAMGVENYGVYAALWSLVSLLGFIDNALRSAAERYFAVALGSNDTSLLRATYRSIHHTILRLTVITGIAAEAIGVPIVMFVLRLPSGETAGVMWAYQLALITLLAGIIAIPYHSLLVAEERMGIIARVQIIMAAYTLAGIACLPLFPDTLVAYSALIASAAIITNSAWYIAAMRGTLRALLVSQPTRDGNHPHTTESFLRFSLWNGMGEASLTVCHQGLNLLLNLFFGPMANAARSIASQIQTFAAKLFDNYRLPLSPQLMTSYAELSTAEFADSRSQRLFHVGSLTGTALMIAFGLPVCFCCNGLLHLWLGTDVPPDAVVFSCFLIAGMIVEAMSFFAVVLIKASGCVKRYYPTASLLQLTCLPLAAILLWAGAPAWVAPASYVVSQCAVTAYRAAYIRTIGLPFDFLRKILWPSLLGTIAAGACCVCVTALIPTATTGSTISATLLAMVLSGIMVYFIMVPRQAKQLISNFMHRS